MFDVLIGVVHLYIHIYIYNILFIYYTALKETMARNIISYYISSVLPFRWPL